jgi:cobalamin biosynthesis protein CbiG
VGQVGQQLLGLPYPHLGADRDADLERVPAAAVLAGSAPVGASLRAEVGRLLEAGQVAQIGIGDQDDITAVAAVTSVRTTLRHELLAAEADAAVAAPAALDEHVGAVGEHRQPPPPQAAGSAACTLM